MSDGALSLLALGAAIVGMACFALSNDLHWRQVLGKRAQGRDMRRGCKALGAAFLALCFVFCALADPISMAMLVWPMLLGIAAAVVAALLTVRARVGGSASRRITRRRHEG